MIDQVIELIKPGDDSKLVDLCWLDGFGGLAKVMTKFVELENGGIGKLRFPVKCNTHQIDCFEPKGYMPLAPDKTKKSVFYFIQRGPTEIGYVINKGLRGGGRTARKSGWERHKTTVRLYVWLNLPLLGYTGCSMCHAIYSDLAKVFSCKCRVPEDHPYKSALRNIKFTLKSINSYSDTLNDFNTYSYAEEYCLYMLPFEICSFDVEIQYDFNPKCLELIQCADNPEIC